MKSTDKTYSNGQPVTSQDGDVLTYYFKDGDVKAQGRYVNGVLDGEWIFNKKEGYLWQVGHFKNGERHGTWVRYKADGSVEKERTFEHDKEVS